ncbi:MAG: hypothetical protein M0R46_06545 [Candidatus Muirbacterium halophilum]|nr:hypothetical protein [Candidatus Muirbacterium halophilum]
MDKLYIQELLQKIQNREFKDSSRRKMVIYHDRINCCCPICGDSSKNKNAKRGNLYFNTLKYICFNCGKVMSFDKYCKHFDESIDPDKKLEMIEFLNSTINYSNYESDLTGTTLENLIDLSELERVFNQNLTPISDFQPIVKGGGVYKYLINRGIPEDKHKNIYQAKFWINESPQWIIISLNRRDDKILGMQVRNLKEGKKRMFKIYNYENLLEFVNIGKENIIEPDMNELVIYNKLSYYYNILNVELTNTITVFEGYLDSLFYPNSIGLVGVNSDLNILENNGLDLQYFFDNDEAGFRKTEQKLKEGYPVFLWNKLFENIVNKKKTDDPDKLLYRISKVKDMNKLAQIVPTPYSKLELYNFFSKDIFDIKYIPKFKKKKKEIEIDFNSRFDNLTL